MAKEQPSHSDCAESTYTLANADIKIPHKRQDIELVRVVSTFAVVWYHCNTIGSEAAYSGLIVFILISFLLDSNRDIVLVTQYAREKSRRLLVPWAIWLLIYGTFNLIAGKPIIRLDYGLGLGVLAGTSIHLWYFPFIFVCMLIYMQLRTFISPPVLAVAGCCLFSVAMVETPIWRPRSLALGYPLAQYVHASAGLALAVFLSNARYLPIAATLLGATIALICTASAIPWDGVGTPYFISILVGLLVAFKILDTAFRLDFSKLSKYCFGIYLVHIFVLSATNKVGVLSEFNLGALTPLIVFFISLALVAFGKSKFPEFSKYAL